MLFDKKKVMQFIPHRDPFLFVDGIQEIIYPKFTKTSGFELKDLVGGTVTGKFHLNTDHPILAGHFPGNPIFPGVCQLEMMAQVSIFITTKCITKDLDKLMLEVALVGSDKSRFRKPVLPGMDLTIKTELLRARGIFLSFKAQILNGTELMSDSEFMATCHINYKE